MCGIVGVLKAADQSGREQLGITIRRMSRALIHRGPDGDGHWIDARNTVALGHRRLAIVDLSPEGGQPMLGPSGRFCVVFNGEIYNHSALAVELRNMGWPFRGRSDTEVLVAGFEAWGVRETLSKLVGMFAIAAWDNAERKLYLVRDRLGEKPLYYGYFSGGLVFSSELKALKEHPDWPGGEISRQALNLYLRYGYIPSPHSIYSGISKLPPGAMLVFREREGCSGGAGITRAEFDSVKPEFYWDIGRQAEGLILHRGKGGTEAECIKALDDALRLAVEDQMVADVPLGGFLSGGVDSSTIVAIMQAVSNRPVNTFTIGFGEHEFNEAEHAKSIAAHLGTNHTELYVTSSMALDAVQLLPIVYDEPFADSSQIPTLLLSNMARNHVTVCLSGDGGDELFCGYNRYIYADTIAKSMLPYPRALRRIIARLLSMMPPEAIYRCLQMIAPLYPRLKSLNNANVKNRVAKLIYSLEAESLLDLYRALVSYWPHPGDIIKGESEGGFEHLSEEFLIPSVEALDQMMYWDLRTYLPDDNLVKGDRASMHYGLEMRLPLLDHRVVELALSFGTNLKLQGGDSKWVLRQVLYKYVPRGLIDRPKMGFSIPIAHWLRHELREWAEFLLDRSRLASGGIFHPEPVRTAWREHINGEKDNSNKLWAILMFEAWRNAQGEGT